MHAPTEQLYAIEVAPQWVIDRPVDVNVQHDAAPFFYLLADYQDYVDRERTFSYTRTVQKINDASRLEDASLLVSELNEKHQRVFFHHIEIIRNGQRINALDPENIAVYQRETSLESHIVTGRKTVALTIDDLRVGDILDVRMTFCNFMSTHPLHGKFYLSTFWVSWSCPVISQSVRVINSGHLPLLYQEGGANETLGEVHRVEAGSEFSRQWDNLSPESLGHHVPSWVWRPFLQFTTGTTWPDVSRYLYQYYEANGVLDTKIDIHNIDLLDLSGLQEDDLLRMVRFVQNNVRYRGENHGIYTHTPKSPERTLKKRAGDCKDKSNLLVALLRRLGVDANLVLVNSRVGHKLQGLNPSAYQFDHMIVKVRSRGRTLYFDPTIQAQAGDLEHCAQLNYGYGLELTAEGCELEALPFDVNRVVFELEHEFDFSHLKSDAELTITRRYFYHRADNMRFYLNSKNQQTLHEDYLRGARETTGCRLEVIQPVTLQDDTHRNVLQTVERYHMVDLAQTHPEAYMQITTEFANDYPVTLDDSAPLDLNVDGALSHSVVVTTRTSPKAEPSQAHIDNKWFHYSDKVAVRGNQMRFLTRLTPRARHALPEEIAAYTKDVDHMRSRCSNNFRYHYPGFFSFSKHTWVSDLLRTAGVFGFVLVALVVLFDRL
ncbi:MAG: DUF3857 domain-containing protein [Pseudomonadota bacterium]